MFSSQNSQVSSDVKYIEDYFSTYLHSGNDSTQTITNGIDLATKGGLVWFKGRNTAGTNNLFIDTVRGGTKELYSNTTDAQSTWAGYDISSFNSNGFSLQGDRYWNNRSGQTYVSWTLAKAPKFFDVVTYTGDGTTSRAISHSLTSTPGCIIVKRTDSTGSWYVYHRGVDPTSAYAWYLLLNSTAARAGAPAVWDAPPTSTTFTVQNGTTNDSGATYVAYLFAHNAGGFGLTGTDNVISCGSYTGNGSATGPTVTLGYEPQWLLVKRAVGGTEFWQLIDNMRSFTADGTVSVLYPNASNAENAGLTSVCAATATGFQIKTTSAAYNASGNTYIYIAIRRGPMKVPTSGTSVFAPVTYTGDGSSTRDLTFGFPVDMFLVNYRGVSAQRYLRDRLRGGTVYLSTPSTSAEAASYTVGFDSNTGINDIPPAWDNANGYTFVDYGFQRAPSTFDEVCYTGNGTSGREITHNLGVAPELMIVKSRSGSGGGYFWAVYCSKLSTAYAYYLALNSTDASTYDPSMWTANPTSTIFKVGSGLTVNESGTTYVAYLWATNTGVTKIGSYTGNGSSQTINCGFTGGARLVLIKRTDSTGDWYVWDSARGIVSGNDPHLSLNTTAAEVTTDDTIDTDSTGFVVNQVSATNVNVNAAKYIFLSYA